MFATDIIRSSLVIVLLSQLVCGSSAANSVEIQRAAISAEIRSHMNTSADPCENFYNFVCGNYRNAKYIKASRSSLGMVEWDRKTTQLLATRYADDTEFEVNVKDYYESCLSGSARDHLHELVNEFGEMPALVDDWQESEFDWLKTVAEIKYRYDIDIIIGSTIKEDPNGGGINRLFIFRPNMDPIFNSKARKQKIYKSLLQNKLTTLLGLDEDVSHQVTNEIFNFEKSLAAATTASDTSFSTTVEELQEKYSPTVDFKKLLEISLGSLPSDLMYASHSEYLEHLAHVMQTTPKHVVANYMFYKLILRFLPQKSDSEACYEETKLFFADVTENMAYRKSNTKQAEAAIAVIFQALQHVFESALVSDTYYSWISRETRDSAVKKLRAMKIKILNFQEVNFTQEYGALNTDKDNYVANRKLVYARQANKTRANLDKPLEAERSRKDADSPIYYFKDNIILVPLSAIGSEIVWSNYNPVAINLGQLGLTVGHEMVHAFHDVGQTVDGYGIIDHWWDSESKRNYDKRSQCFIDQISNFIYGGKKLPRTGYEKEIIADNGGLQLAHVAYMAWYRSVLDSKTSLNWEQLPGLPYADHQLFFISFGQFFCSVTDPRYMNYVASIDKHPPESFRVNNALSNYEAFSKAFNCPKGSAMNPEDKCQIF